MFKPFFFHYNKGPGKLPNSAPRGFTAHFRPSSVYSRKCVMMSIAWCSPKDEFNKKTGRITALNKVYKEVQIKEIPGLISGARNIVTGINYAVPENFYWMYRYFL